MAKARPRKKAPKPTLPIAYWSYSSLMSFLRNPLAWKKRYVEKIYDMPRTPSAVIGISGHIALEHFYRGVDKETAVKIGLEAMRKVPDFELNFGKAKSRRAQKEKRASMEREYLQAIGFYLARAPKHKVVGVEVKSTAHIPGILLPIKAISDLVIESRTEPGSLDIVDHKFVDTFSGSGAHKPLFALQAIFNYYTVKELYQRPIRCFIVYECKKKKNKDGRAQLRKYTLDYSTAVETFEVFHRLLHDATEEIKRERKYLPNPSDMFEGEHSFELYRLGLLDI